MAAVLCRGCGAALTGELTPGELRSRGSAVERGTFAVDATARTVRFWTRGMADGQTEARETDPPMSIVVHPDDRLTDALVEVFGRSAGCCGLDGCDGPNQRCKICGAIVATARTDCWTEKEVRFLPAETVLGSP